MLLFKITDIKKFMNSLLIDKTFDQFLIAEATIKMASTYIIDGHINKSFFTDEELSELNETATQNGRIFSDKMQRFYEVKPICLSIIKGKKTPTSFKFTFCLSGENTDKFLNTFESDFKSTDIGNLTLNIKYDGTELTATTSVSLNIFSLDKSIDTAWDNMIKKFFSSNDIKYEEL